jgi:hypothetical protein
MKLLALSAKCNNTNTSLTINCNTMKTVAFCDVTPRNLLDV